MHLIKNYLFLKLKIFRKILELEEELKVVGSNVKSLEVSEEKVRAFLLIIILIGF